MEDTFAFFSSEILYKMLKLFAYAGCTVHTFSCIYWRVKIETSDSDEVTSFLNSHNVASSEVSCVLACSVSVLIVFSC